MKYFLKTKFSITILILTTFSCDSPRSTFFINDIRSVLALFSQKPEGKEFDINAIVIDGTKKPLDGATFKSDGKLSFNVKSADYLNKDTQFITEAEKIVAMGNSIRSYPNNTQAVIRVEVAEKISNTKISGEMLYLHFPIAFTESDLLNANQEYGFSDIKTLTKVGYEKIEFKDLDTNEAISDVSFISIVGGSFTETAEDASKTLKEYSLWEDYGLRPSISNSDKNGIGTVFPIVLDNNNQYYSIIAWAKGYCTYVSRPYYWNISKEKSEIIKLKECKDVKIDSTDFVLSAGQNELEHETTIDSGGKEKAIFSNKNYMTGRIDSFSNKVGGISLRLLEGLSPTGIANPSVNIVEFASDKRYFFKFQSDFSFTLPDYFLSTGTSNGNFSIEVTSKHLSPYSEKTKHLYGKKLFRNLPLDFASTYIKSYQVENVLSGLDESTITISYKNCDDETKFGIKYLGETTYELCNENIALFKTSDIGLDPNKEQIGGQITLEFKILDLYNNESTIGSSNTQRSVFIDYGKPKLDYENNSSVALMRDLGLAESIDTPGTNATPYIFRSGALVGGVSNTLIVTKNSVSGLVFRFKSPNKCFIEGDSKDGESVSDLGEKIYAMRIASSSSRLSSKEYEACGYNDSEANDLLLSYEDIVFPNSTSEKASFYLQVKDLAGNESEPTQYFIDPCPNDLTGIRICWQ